MLLLMAYKSVMNERKKLEPESDLFGTPKKIFRRSLNFEATPVFSFLLWKYGNKWDFCRNHKHLILQALN